MRNIRSRSVALSIAFSALVPSLMFAQTRPAPRPRAAEQAPNAAGPAGAPSGPGERARGPGARDGRGGGHPAALLLRARTQLGLTDDQITRLEALQSAPAPKSNATDMMRARADLLDATQGDGNLAGARAALDKLSRLRNDQMIARIKAQQDARAVLTPAQKTKMDKMRQQLRNRVGAARQRGMRKGGRGGKGFRGGPPMGAPMGPGMMPGNRSMGPQGGQGAMPRMRRGGGIPDMAPPAPPVF